jgi:hypothetical protein
MGAALHSSVLQQQAELGPGCVLLLQHVSVFTPTPGTTYAAVTAHNIVRVSKKTPTGSCSDIHSSEHWPCAFMRCSIAGVWYGVPGVTRTGCH